MADQLSPLFEAAVKAKRIPGIAAVALDVSGNVLFKGAFGTTNLSELSATKMTTSTKALIWSCTKLSTAVAALQLLEQGKIRLDDPVEKYVPAWKKLQVLEGFSEDGKPVLRAPHTTATILMLMTHITGLSYEFTNQGTLKWRLATGDPPAAYILQPSKNYYEIPLAFDPGIKYEYGINTDYLGFVIEAVSGLSLHEYLEKNILLPLGMKNTREAFDSEDSNAMLHLHHRGVDGSLTVDTRIQPPAGIPVRGGGHYVVSTLDDYSTFLLAILNGGILPASHVSQTRILQEDTVRKYLFTDMLPQICSADGVGCMKTVLPNLTNNGEFLPGVRKGWSCGLMMNLDACEQGRSSGSGAWAGLGNQYYWLDPVKGKLGLVIAQVWPFMDEQVLHLFDALEKTIYGHDATTATSEQPLNYRLGLKSVAQSV